MSSVTPVRIGQSNGAGGVLSLFDDIFYNLVNATFETETKFMGLTRKRMIENGTGATFPHIGQIDGRFHQPGTDITDGGTTHAETFIPVDEMIIAHAWLARQDEWRSQLDLRNEYAIAIARGLARSWDKLIAFAMVRGARSSSALTGRPGGTTGGQDEAAGAHSLGGTVDDRVRDANALTNASTLSTLIANAVQILDEKDVPENDRFTILRPAQYMLLLKAGLITMDRDFGGVGSAAMKTMPWLFGTRVIMSNHLPSTRVGGPAAGTAGVSVNDSSSNKLFGDATDNDAQSGGNDYSGDNNDAEADLTLGFSKTAAIVGQREAMGTVVLHDVDMESEYYVRNQAHLMVGRYMAGTKVLRPECLVEVTANADTN